MAYLEDLGCLGTALVKLLGGEVAFKVMDDFEVVLRDELILVLACCQNRMLDFFIIFCQYKKLISQYQNDYQGEYKQHSLC